VHLTEVGLGQTGQPLKLNDGESITGGWMFKVQNGLEHVVALHDRMLARGAFLFLVEATPDGQDVIAVLPTTDKYEVIRIIGTNGNAAHTHDQVVAWLKDLDRSEPWLLVGANFDSVDLFFTGPVRDPHALAQNVLSFCPDFYYQGIGLDPETHGRQPLEVIEEYFRNERLSHFWWD
jgi:hypothetical protein